MTRPDLDALAALLDKATPGPWRNAPRGPQDWHRVVDDANTRSLAACGDEENAALIVALRNAAPALLAYVRELEQWQHDMVEKATAKSLDGYRELAARAAWKEEA